MNFLFFLSLFCKYSYSISKLVRESAIEITQKLEQSPKSIVFVTDNENSLDFSYSAINEYKNQINFYLTSPNEVPSSFYTTDPSIIVFKYTKPWNIEPPPLDSTSFSYWVQRVIDPTHYTIALPQQLEKILKGTNSVLFEIDGGSKKDPKMTENEITIFKSKSSLFKKFQSHIQPGLYAYRPQDKRMIPYNGSFALQVSSPLTHFSLIDKNSNKYTIAFIIDEWGEKCSEQYDMLEKLSNTYGNERYYYTLINTPNASKLFRGIGIYSFDRPIFIVSNISSDPPLRWIYNKTAEGEVTLESLKKFVSEIESNQKVPTIISEPIPNYSKENPPAVQPIVNLNFADLVYDDSCETVVMFVANDNIQSKLLAIVFKAVANILDNKYTKFYTFNVTKNDIPEDVPDVSTYPMCIMWPAGKKDQPKVFSGEVTFKNVFDFIKECASHKIAIPKFDPKQVVQSITEKINKLLKKEQKEDL